MYRTLLSKDQISELKVIHVGNIPSARMNEETAQLDELETYYTLEPVAADVEMEGRAVKMAWFDESKRAVIINGREVRWTYADDPEDAAERWLADDLDEEADPRPAVLRRKS